MDVPRRDLAGIIRARLTRDKLQGSGLSNHSSPGSKTGALILRVMRGTYQVLNFQRLVDPGLHQNRWTPPLPRSGPVLFESPPLQLHAYTCNCDATVFARMRIENTAAYHVGLRVLAGRGCVNFLVGAQGLEPRTPSV